MVHEATRKNTLSAKHKKICVQRSTGKMRSAKPSSEANKGWGLKQKEKMREV
jgi:hypothetical protein